MFDEQFVDNRPPSRSVCNSNTFLDDVRGELLSGESGNVAEELANDGFNETVVVQVEDVLYNVVSLQEEARLDIDHKSEGNI